MLSDDDGDGDGDDDVVDDNDVGYLSMVIRTIYVRYAR